MTTSSNPGSKHTQWSYGDVDWVRDRYSITGNSHSFDIEIVPLNRTGRRGWSLMVAKEHWWAGTRTEAIKSTHWARPVSGNRKDIIEWFRKQEAALERDARPSRHGASH